jgi:hypothetical protein
LLDFCGGQRWPSVGGGAAEIPPDTRGYRGVCARLEDWVGFLTQNGAFNAGGQPLYALIRAYRLFVELPRTPAAGSHL